MFATCKNLLNGSFRTMLFCGLIVLSGWRFSSSDEHWKWIQRCLIQSYNQQEDSPLKKWDLSVTPKGFFRLKKYFPSGKQEYFSFHFNKIKDIEYSGTSASGDILFKTLEDDIIVQTFNDPKGNIDSMSTVLRLPVLNMEPQTWDTLKTTIISLRNIRNE